MKVVTIIQARTTSSRLPNKVMMDIYGKSLLERVIDQSLKIENSDEVWVATSIHENDDLVEYLCERKGVACYRGSLEDVRGRFVYIARETDADFIVRVTADNPLTEPVYAEQLIETLKRNPEYDYARMDKSTIIDGTHSEVFTRRALEKSLEEYKDLRNKEHVTPAMIEEMKMIEPVPERKDLIVKKPYFAGVDTFEDIRTATLLYRKFGEEETLEQLIKEINENGKAI